MRDVESSCPPSFTSAKTAAAAAIAADDISSLDSHAHAGKERKVQSHLGIHKDGCFFIQFSARTLMSFSGLYLRYPSDADKHLLARQTGLSRNQVSNWFINARVRLWKPMVEEMYQQEAKGDGDNNNNNSNNAQTSTPSTAAATAAATAPPSTTMSVTTTPAGNRSEINAKENDPSLVAINNTQGISENQSKQCTPTTTTTTNTNASEVTPPISQPFPTTHDSDIHHRIPGVVADDTCHRGSVGAADYGTGTPGNTDIGSTLIRTRFGTTAGDVSLTLGLRHAGNIPEKSSSFSVRDFGGC